MEEQIDEATGTSTNCENVQPNTDHMTGMAWNEDIDIGNPSEGNGNSLLATENSNSLAMEC
jgi:hypothetical protein